MLKYFNLYEAFVVGAHGLSPSRREAFRLGFLSVLPWLDALLPLALLAILIPFGSILGPLLLILWVLLNLIAAWAVGFGLAPILIGLLVLFGVHGLVFGEATRPTALSSYLFIAASACSVFWRLRLNVPGLALWLSVILALDLVSFASFYKYLSLAEPGFRFSDLAVGFNFERFRGALFRLKSLGVNDTGFVLAMSVLLCFGSAGFRRIKLVRAGFACSALWFLFLIPFTQSRMAGVIPWASLLIAWLLWLIARFGFPHIVVRFWLPASLGLISALGVSLYRWLNYLFLHAQPGQDSMADLNRIRLIACYLRLSFSSFESALLGIGYGNAVPLGCGLAVYRGEGGRSFNHVHNAFVQALVENGVLAALAACAVILCALLSWLHLCRSIEWSSFWLQDSLLPVGFAMLIGFLLYSLVELSFMRRIPLQFLFGVLLALPFGLRRIRRAHNQV